MGKRRDGWKSEKFLIEHDTESQEHQDFYTIILQTQESIIKVSNCYSFSHRSHCLSLTFCHLSFIFLSISSFFSLDRCSIPSSEVSILWSYLDITLLFSSYVYLILSQSIAHHSSF